MRSCKPENERNSLLDNLSTALRAHIDRDRKRHPQRFLDLPDGLGRNHLFVQNVANMLGCNVDFVRRIPRSELPASTVAGRLIYARSDVEAYIHSKRETGPQRYVPDRAPSTKKASDKPPRGKPVAASRFDPVAFVRS